MKFLLIPGAKNQAEKRGPWLIAIDGRSTPEGVAAARLPLGQDLPTHPGAIGGRVPGW